MTSEQCGVLLAAGLLGCIVGCTPERPARPAEPFVRPTDNRYADVRPPMVPQHAIGTEVFFYTEHDGCWTRREGRIIDWQSRDVRLHVCLESFESARYWRVRDYRVIYAVQTEDGGFVVEEAVINKGFLDRQPAYRGRGEIGT